MLFTIKEVMNLSSTESKKHYDYLLKILMVGNSGVGKSSILVSYVDDSYADNYVSTIGIDLKVKMKSINGKKVKLQLWDTAGQERFRSVISSYFRCSKGIIMVYDISSRQSFNDLRLWHDTIKKYCSDKSYKVIVAGNKADIKNKRIVSKQEGQKFADEINAIHMEISAKNKKNLNKMFDVLAKSIIDDIELQYTDSVTNITINKQNDKNSCC